MALKGGYETSDGEKQGARKRWEPRNMTDRRTLSSEVYGINVIGLRVAGRDTGFAVGRWWCMMFRCFDVKTSRS